MSEAVMYKGWTEPLLREGLRLASDTSRSILGYIASDGPCTTLDIAEALGLRNGKSVAPYLQQFTRATEDLGVQDTDGKYHWPLSWGDRRDGQDVYDMPDEVRQVVLAYLAEN